MLKTSLTLFSVLVLTLVPETVHACTSFCLVGKNKVVVGKSYDWFFGHGYGAVFVNPRGVKRTTMIFDKSADPAKWKSRFGSVTLTQFGRGVPISGVNEKGLVVELLQLETAAYNSQETEKPYVNESQWAQFQLDNYAGVAEVIANKNSLHIEKAFTGIHYFVADKTGASATVEFLDGKVVVHAGNELPVPALTNDPYEYLVDYLKAHQGPPASGFTNRTSEVRFQCAKVMIDKVSSTPDDQLVGLAWQTLETVRLNGFARDAIFEPSQWNIVYDLTEGKLRFRTRTSPGTKEIDVTKIDFSENCPEKMFDMNQQVQGDITNRFVDYDFELNGALVRKNSLLFTLAGQRQKVKTAVEYGRVDKTHSDLIHH